MWREYTRETPARRGWPLAGGILALAGTTALAWMVTDRVTAPPPLVPVEPLPHWPIRFAVPAGFELGRSEASTRWDGVENGDGGIVLFIRGLR
jgi:hypothetical protein